MKQALGFVAGSALLVLSTAAWAMPAVVSTDLNVRSGESTRNHVVAVMPRGSIVDVTGCGDGWCYVRDYGGFANARYLDVRSMAYRPGYDAYAYSPTYGPSFSFGIGYRRGYSPWWDW